LRRDPEPTGRLFGRVEVVDQRLAGIAVDEAALVQHEFDVAQEIEALIDEPSGAKAAPRLLVRRGQEDHVTIQGVAGPLERDHREELGDRHPFAVERAAAIDDAVDDGPVVRLVTPLRAVHGNDVDVVEQKQRLACPVAGEPRIDARTPRLGLQNGRRDALGLEQLGEKRAPSISLPGGLVVSMRM
jgi:hypothetical protein